MTESNTNESPQYELFYAQEKNYFPQDFFDIIIEEIIIEEELDQSFEVGLSLVSNDHIQKLNKKYRNKDYATDVLAFREKDSSEPWPENESKEKVEYLGDIIISIDKADEQAAEQGKTLEEEVGFLFIHGFYHLLGYDHERSEEDERIMTQKTEAVHNKLKKDNANN